MRIERDRVFEPEAAAKVAPARLVPVIAAVLLCGSICGLGLWIWVFGGLLDLRIWAAEGQRAAQATLAGGLRGLRAGEPGALWGLCGVAFAYGVFHAAGPGHGKVILGGYGLGQSVALRRLAALSIVASLAQALSAVALVLGAVTLLSWGRGEVTHVAEQWLAPVSYLLMALVGAYLAGRGLLRLAKLARPETITPCEPPATAARVGFSQAARGHLTGVDQSTWNPDRRRATGAVCPDCGHRHGPSLDEVAQLRSVREAVVLVAVIAIRPCTGAIFLLLLTWRMGVFHAGVLGALAMGVGTALVTCAVALGAAGVRQGTFFAALTGAASSGRLRWLAAGLEALAGLLVVTLCLGLLWPSLA